MQIHQYSLDINLHVLYNNLVIILIMKGIYKMRVERFNSYEEMSEFIASAYAAQLILKPESVLGFATGSTPLGAYAKLIEMYKAGKVDFSKCTSFNLDEYYPISRKNDQSYYYFMMENLFKHINIRPESIHVPNGEVSDYEKECEDYDNLIDEFGGIDLQLLGIGENGHIGFNEPEAKLYNKTHMTGLTESTIAANARFFASADEVPKNAITMGVGSIFKARKIIIAINGKKKLDAFNKLMEDRIDTSCPATLLNLHSDVIVAYSEN